MKQCTLVLLAAWLGGVTAYAQNVPASGPGLLGQRYAGAAFTYAHVHSVRYTDAEGASTKLNLPVTPGLDAAFTYDFSHLMGPEYSRPEHVLGASLVTYNQDEYGKPFFVAGLSEVMQRPKVQGVTADHNDTLWNLGAGVEVPFGNELAVTYRIDYSRAFTSGPIDPTWSYLVQVNRWFTRNVCGVLSFTYNQIKHAPDTLAYTVGVRMAF